jgi:hypothetical protein
MFYAMLYVQVVDKFCNTNTSSNKKVFFAFLCFCWVLKQSLQNDILKLQNMHHPVGDKGNAKVWP